MKKYLAIGHFKGHKDQTISVAMTCNSMKSFRENLAGNEFVSYANFTEDRMKKFEAVLDDPMACFEEVKKLTTNYRVWNHLMDYIEQCFDIMQERIENAE